MSTCFFMLLKKVKSLIPANAWITDDDTPLVTSDGDFLIFSE